MTLDNSPSDPIREHIFHAFGMDHENAKQSWKNCPTAKLVSALRNNTGRTQNDIASLLGGTTRRQLQTIESSLAPEHIDQMAGVVKPLLQEIAHEGWILHDSYAVNRPQFESLALASRYLETRKKIDRGWPTGVKSFSVVEFENEPYVPVANIRSIATSLCAVHGCKTLKELFSKANLAAQKQFLFDRSTRREIGKALGAILEFMDLYPSVLTPDIFSYAPAASNFIAGKRDIAYERIVQIPDRIRAAKAYNDIYSEGFSPEDAGWHSVEELERSGLSHEEAEYRSVQEFTQAGLALAALDKNYLRAAIARLLQECGKPQKLMEANGGTVGVTVNSFLNNRGVGKNLSTFAIAAIGKELGVPNIFTLEKMGKAVLEQANGLYGRGVDDRGKPLPDMPDATTRAGGHFALTELKRLKDEGKFRE